MHREAGIPSPGTRHDGVGVTDRALQPCAIDHAEPATLLRQKVSHDPPGRFVRKARGMFHVKHVVGHVSRDETKGSRTSL